MGHVQLLGENYAPGLFYVAASSQYDRNAIFKML